AVRSPTTGMATAPGRRQPFHVQFPRGGDQFGIGRDATCDLAIPDMTVSRLHARLERTDDGWLLSDLESRNGTRVNGWLVRGKVPVRVGDLVSFGSLDVIFAAAPPEAPPSII
ncbi:MAG: FHA domain-containing protein, partial [Trebonia sp.]